MNATLLEDTLFRDKLQQDWAKWKHQKKRYPNSVTWWGQYVKKKIQYIFMTEWKERARNDTMMENFYYSCIYDILKEPTEPREKLARLHRLKAKIIKLHNKRLQTITIDARDPTIFQGENPSLFHLIDTETARGSNDARHPG